jgi:hypothetical protein
MLGIFIGKYIILPVPRIFALKTEEAFLKSIKSTSLSNKPAFL